ncbi:Purine nucleoside phosphorylase [Burkholderia pseudomallei]|nr:Purine nucleoside phosphorylase [Burkholderia pseudomallei]
MKSLVYAVVAASALTASFGAFAQSSQPLTRAQVRAELVQLEKAGYHPGVSSPYYPEDIQAAQARVQGADTSGYGAQAAPVAPVAHVGAPVAAAPRSPRESIYFGQ